MEANNYYQRIQIEQNEICEHIQVRTSEGKLENRKLMHSFLERSRTERVSCIA